MTALDHWRGHAIEAKRVWADSKASIISIEDEWFFVDTGDPVWASAERSCGKCGKQRTAAGHDDCLGTLSGVMNACCGHGDAALAYVQYREGLTFRGRLARVLIWWLTRKKSGRR